MSKATVCDNCQTVASNFTDTSPNDDWLSVGWFAGPRYDVCSAACAKAVIEEIVANRAEIDAKLEAEFEAEEAAAVTP